MDVQLGPVLASVPAHPACARTVRLLIANVAASAGLAFDRVDDAALAANEAFGLLLLCPGATEVECEASGGDGWVEVVVRALGPSVGAPRSDPWADELTQRVLAGTTDSLECRPDEARISFRITGS